MPTNGMERGLSLAGGIAVLAGGRVALSGRTAEVTPADVRAMLTRQYQVAP